VVSLAACLDRNILLFYSGALGTYSRVFWAFLALFYFVFSRVREIVCTTICPYGRLQGAMMDKNSMQISYDYVRGEPRGKFSKHREESLGNCVDCHKCVDVCTTGIDIRNGSQMECVRCTACIDACDEIMEKFNFEKGLIRYASENQISEKKPFEYNTRMKAYTVVLLILITIVAVLIYRIRSIDTYIVRTKGQLYQEIGTDTLSNMYTLKIINKTDYEIIIYEDNKTWDEVIEFEKYWIIDKSDGKIIRQSKPVERKLNSSSKLFDDDLFD
jgi:cytochrome c oxidase accessory protein FixG